VNGSDFKSLSEVLEKIRQTNSKLEKISKLGNFLKTLDDESLFAALRLLTSSTHPPWTNVELQVGYSTLTTLLLEISGISKKKFSEIYLKHGDLGDTAEEIIAQGKVIQPLVKEDLSIIKVFNILRKVAEYEGEGSYSFRKNALRELFINASPIEAKYLIKIITGELRIGLSEGLLEEALAYALNMSVSNLREKILLLPDIAEVSKKLRRNPNEEIELELLRPTSFMLAEPMSSAEEIANYFNKEIIAEFKYDGIRAQIHKKGDKVKIFSRRLDEISFYLPEIKSSIVKLKDDFILDSEIISFKQGKPVSFNILQRRLRRKEIDKELLEEIPLRAIVYDVLYYKGKIVYKLPLKERKVILTELDLKDNLELGFYKYVKNSLEISKLFEESLNKGFEGLMIKDPDSPYSPGKRGKAWIKLKKEFDTLDVVIVAAEYGHGKRAGVFSDYTFAVRNGDQLKIIGKAYSGLTDEEIEMMDKLLRSLCIEDLGYKIIVRPKVVLEVAFDSIQESDRHDSGFALRFPRIKRIRWDKSIEEIDTLDRVKEIYSRKRASFA